MQYAKALAACVVALIGSLVMALGPGEGLGDLSLLDGLTAVLAVLGSSGIVWYVENGPAARYAKALVAFCTAGVASLVVALSDNMIDTAEMLTAVSVALVASGIVYRVPNADPVT